MWQDSLCSLGLLSCTPCSESWWDTALWAPQAAAVVSVTACGQGLPVAAVVVGSPVRWWLCCQASTTAQFAAAVWLLAGSGVVLLHPPLRLAGRGAAHPSSPALLAHVCVVCVSMRASGHGRSWCCAAHLVGSTRCVRCVCGEGPKSTCVCWQSCAVSLQLRREPAAWGCVQQGGVAAQGGKNVAKAWACVCGVGRPGVWVGAGLGFSVCMVCCMALWMQARPRAARA